MPHDVFISYSSIDKAAADTVCSVLEQNGIRCWMAPRNITPGIDFSEAIIDGIRSSKVFLLVYSSNSNNSKQVIREVDRAVDAGLPFINLRLEDVPMSKQLEYYLSSVHWFDAMIPPLEEHVNKLSGVIKIFLVSDEVKDADLDKAIKEGTLKVGHGKRTIASAGKPWKKAAISMAALGVLLVVALLIGLPRWKQKISLETTAMDKSIAVLPFTNLSNDPEQEYFSDGMLDEILDRLFKIGDLKVISRTSSMRYKNSELPLKEIASELGVATILEGSVRKLGNNLRITVQLIDARTDTHLWSEIYDRDFSDVFEIQSEIAQTIARELKAVITPYEHALIEKAPTKNMEAYNFFLIGNDYFWRSFEEQDYSIAISMYEKAIELDPGFALAYIRLAISHSSMYWFHYDRSAERIIKCKEAIDAATRIDPEIPEIHLALGYYYYMCFLDYPRALEELNLAETKLPNNPECIYLKASIYRRAGEWKSARDYFLLAFDLDPGSSKIAQNVATTIFPLGEFTEAEKFFNKATLLSHASMDPYYYRSLMYFKWMGNTVQARETIREALKFKEAANNSQIIETLAMIDLYDGHYQKAISFLLSKDIEVMENQFNYHLKSFHIANIHRIMGEIDVAHNYYDLSRILLETRLQKNPDDPRLYSALGKVYAGLGLKEKAIESGIKGVELMPIEKEAYRGVFRVEDLARIYVMTGDYQEAIKLLDKLLSVPGIISVKLLLLDPTWKPLWNLSEFKILTNKYNRHIKYY